MRPILSPAPPAQAVEPERRGTPRHPTLQRCLVWVASNHGPGAWHCIVYNVSTSGLGIALPLPVPLGQTLRVQPYGVPGARVVLVRVVHVKPVEFVWFTGCELTEPLDDEQLQAWQKVSLGWLHEDRPAQPW